MEPSRFEVFKQASKIATEPPSPKEILIAIVLIIFFILVFIVLPWFLYKKYKERVGFRAFLEVAISNNLTPEEAEFLWKLAKEFNTNPHLLLTSHAVFQKTVLKYIQKYREKADLNLISTIGSKLSFTKLPEFIPLSTTLDIDIYQPVSVIVGNEKYDGAVIENTPLYWAVVFLKNAPSNLKPGDSVIVSFIRPNDGRYIVTTKVLEITQQQGQMVARLEHTDKLEKIQLRNFVRWPVNIPCQVALLPPSFLSSLEDLESLIEKVKFHEGVIKDISAGGAKICVEPFEDIKKFQEGSFILVNFVLEDTPFENVLCEIRRVIKTPFSNEICFGCAFVELPKEMQQKILQFIWDEQRKIIKLYKEGGIS